MSEPTAEAIEAEFGPPVLLKRLGNLFEGELARNCLADAGIPSFLAGVDTFSVGGRGARGQVELFVPESLVHDALDLLDAPAFDDPDDAPLAPDDPGRPCAFRAFVAAIAGWLVVFLGPFGVWLAVPLFGYCFLLIVRAVRQSTTGDRTLRLQVAGAGVVAFVGIIVSAALTAEMLGWL